MVKGQFRFRIFRSANGDPCHAVIISAFFQNSSEFVQKDVSFVFVQFHQLAPGSRLIFTVRHASISPPLRVAVANSSS